MRSENQIIDFDSYSATLLREYIPNEIYATRQDEESPWQRGEQRSLIHDQWNLRPESVGNLLVRETSTARFDLPVGEFGLRLNDPTLRNDCLTAKIFCCRSLAMPIKRKKVVPNKCVDFLNAFAWIVRWKLDKGLVGLSELRQPDFHAFLEDLASDDILDLIEYAPRVERMFDDIADGGFRFTRIDPRGRIVYDKEKIAIRLGVTLSSITRSFDFVSMFQDNVASISTEKISSVELPKKPFSSKVSAESSEGSSSSEEGSVKPGSRDDLSPGAESKHIEDQNDEQAEDAGKRGARTVFTYLSVWETLSRLSLAGALPHDPLNFDPFEEEDKKTLQERYGREAGRTANLLPPDFFRVMKVAADWALRYGDYIVEAAELLRINPSRSDRSGRVTRDRLRDKVDAMRPEGAPYLAMHWSTKPYAVSDDVERLPMGRAVKYLLASCAILIAGFSARRLTEFMSLKSDCLIEVKPGIFNLSVYIEKTLQEYDRIPIPAMIKTVVQLLEKLSASSRAESGTEWLFRVKHALEAEQRPFIHFDFSRVVRELLEYVDLEPPAGQKKWKIASHQFRRGYAILYYHGFVMSNFDSIQLMLRHIDPAMSQIYIHDILVGNLGRLRQDIAARRQRSIDNMSSEEQQWLRRAKEMLDELVARHREFEEVRGDAMAYKLLDYWDRQQEALLEEQRFEERISGPGAPALLRALDALEDKARKSVRITSRANSPGAIRQPLFRLIRTWVKDNYLEPVPGYASYCRAKPGHKPHLEVAECLKRKAANQTPWESRQPTSDYLVDHSFSGGYACLVCDLGVRFPENRVVIEDNAATLDLAADKSLPGMRESLQAKAKRYKDKIFETDQIRIKK